MRRLSEVEFMKKIMSTLLRGKIDKRYTYLTSHSYTVEYTFKDHIVDMMRIRRTRDYSLDKKTGKYRLTEEIALFATKTETNTPYYRIVLVVKSRFWGDPPIPLDLGVAPEKLPEEIERYVKKCTEIYGELCTIYMDDMLISAEIIAQLVGGETEEDMKAKAEAIIKLLASLG